MGDPRSPDLRDSSPVHRPRPEDPLLSEPLNPHPALPGLTTEPGAPPPPAPPAPPVAPRVQPVDRSQLVWRPGDVEQLMEPDHPARAIWAVTGRLDLSGFYAPIAAG